MRDDRWGGARTVTCLENVGRNYAQWKVGAFRTGTGWRRWGECPGDGGIIAVMGKVWEYVTFEGTMCRNMGIFARFGC